MAQISLRISDELAEDLKSEAKARELSLNGYLTLVLGVAIDPEMAGEEAERLRERFRRAGLLEEWPEPSGGRPSNQELEAARRRAGQGTPLSDLVSEGRN